MTHQEAMDSFAAERYLLDEMTELERHQFEEHYFACAECGKDMLAASLLRREVRARAGSVPEDRSAPVVAFRSPRTRPRGSVAAVLPWAAAAMLAIVAGYQGFVLLPERRQGTAAEVVAPLALRPASRAAVPTIAIAEGQRFVALAIDVDVREGGGGLAYVLRGPERSQIAAGQAPAPPPGAPLMLLVSTGEIAAPGVYVLTVSTSEGTTEYTFAVQP